MTHSQDTPPCRNCQPAPQLRLKPGEAKRLAEKQLSTRAGELTDETLYQERLAACSDCDDLLGGVTCRHCGCLVAARAWMADQHCPKPATPAW